jgi:hypothetical protein
VILGTGKQAYVFSGNASIALNPVTSPESVIALIIASTFAVRKWSPVKGTTPLFVYIRGGSPLERDILTPLVAPDSKEASTTIPLRELKRSQPVLSLNRSKNTSGIRRRTVLRYNLLQIYRPPLELLSAPLIQIIIPLRLIAPIDGAKIRCPNFPLTPCLSASARIPNYS